MVRTIKDIWVAGRSLNDVQAFVNSWLSQNKFSIIELCSNGSDIKQGIPLLNNALIRPRPGSMVATTSRWGVPIIFEMMVKQETQGVMVHVEGYAIGRGVGMAGQEFDLVPISYSGAPTRKAGFDLINNFEAMARQMSIMQAPALPSAAASNAAPNAYACPTCGQALNFVGQYQKWFCTKCDKYV